MWLTTQRKDNFDGDCNCCNLIAELGEKRENPQIPQVLRVKIG
tara:strand:+ start:253 stop:381 length:129 start_codon:yes stop_codon:yes gene_type:complete